MKRILAVIMAVMLVLSLAACGGAKTETKTEDTANTATEDHSCKSVGSDNGRQSLCDFPFHHLDVVLHSLLVACTEALLCSCFLNCVCHCIFLLLFLIYALESE